MKVLLIKDVYKLGRAGDVKKVADGYGRNFLIPQGLAVLATPSALKQMEHIRNKASAERAAINQEMSSVAELLSSITLAFPAKASETGRLYGSVSPAMIAEELKKRTGVDISRRQVDFEPIRNLGVHKVKIRLTIDLIPEVTVVVYREGETPEELVQAISEPASVLSAEESSAEGEASTAA